jgi:histidyl-tRNA synthetase
MKARAEASGRMIRATETEVLVASIGNGLQAKRMALASQLWAAGIKAEFGFKPNPKMGDQLGAALEQGIPFMVSGGRRAGRGRRRAQRRAQGWARHAPQRLAALPGPHTRCAAAVLPQVLFGEDELAQGVVKVKDMEAKEEAAVSTAELVAVLQAKIAEWRARQQ